MTGHENNQAASTNENVVGVGIDVDDVQYHGSALDRRTGEVFSFQCRPTLKGLVGQLVKVRKHFGGAALKVCYEASYVGLSLQRDLQDRGFDCYVVSPSSIPRRAGKSHWRTHHNGWMERTIEGCTASLKVNLSLLFPQLVSWAGMDIREYASDGKSNRLGITRQGNRNLRTALIEANQRGYRSAVLGKDVKARRASSSSAYVVIADRCLQLLNKKGNRLLPAGKHPNKVKVACAKEMVGFVWESLNQAAAA